MKNLNQFNEKALYVSPSCKSVVLEASASMMSVTSPGYNSTWHTETYGIDEDEDL